MTEEGESVPGGQSQAQMPLSWLSDLLRLVSLWVGTDWIQETQIPSGRPPPHSPPLTLRFWGMLICKDGRKVLSCLIFLLESQRLVFS